MGMSTYVIGLRNGGGEKHRAMCAAWKALESAGISEFPDELREYFTVHDDGEEREADYPDEVLEVDLENTEAVKEWGNQSSEGFEVCIAKLPPGVTHIRFYNSW